MPTHLHDRSAVLVAALSLFVSVPASSADDEPIDERRTIGYGQIAFDGLGPEGWAARARYWHKRYVRARRALLHRTSVVEAIGLSCATYGHCSSLWRKARCESRLYSFARNPSGASGLFQFLPSTFVSTPYGRFSIFSPYANALAAGWMHARGRGGEWACG